jgi:hypothetical protein
VGGIPAVEAGEDRAFVGALARVDARVRHDPAVRVTVSGRIMGRAPGGMADTIRRRIRQQDEFTDGSLEPSIDAYRRFDYRRRIRTAWQLHSTARIPPVELAADLGIPAGALRCMLQGRFFGSTWADIQAAGPFLVWTPREVHRSAQPDRLRAAIARTECVRRSIVYGWLKIRSWQ